MRGQTDLQGIKYRDVIARSDSDAAIHNTEENGDNQELTCHPECRNDLHTSYHPEFISGSQYNKVKEIPKHGGQSDVRNDMTTQERKGKTYETGLPRSLRSLAMTKNRRVAFTLAEVLITLGIIGIVAAMTLPNLIENHQKKVTVTRLKKAYTQLAEAVKMSELENGSIDNWNLDLPAETFMNTYVDPYVKFIGKDYGLNVNQRINYKYLTGGTVTEYSINNSGTPVRQFADGTVVFLDTWSPGNNSMRTLTVDINGYKGPNMLGKDTFSFQYNKENGFGVTKNALNTDRDVLLGRSQHSCNKKAPNGGYSCTAVIVHDGWQIKDDYPW